MLLLRVSKIVTAMAATAVVTVEGYLQIFIKQDKEVYF